MALTPVEIRHVELRRTWFRGYRRGIVERLLSDIADSFEGVWRERADLADQLEELESLLRSTLVSAERAAQDLKEQARRESDLIVQEARAEGRRVTRAATAERDRLEEEIRRIRAHLRSALEAIEEPDEAPETETPPAARVEGVPESGFRRLAG